MDRDSFLGERIIWRGGPKVVETPTPLRWAAIVLFALCVVALCFAIVIATALDASPVSPLLFAVWSSSLGVACLQVPKIWLSQVRYFVTERYVILQRGPFRRTIERKAISFARIHWSSSAAGVGDVDLVRAVPTGALKRRLLLQLRGVAAPDQVWAIIRGVTTKTAPQKGDRPLAQRLDDGERVVWSARPKAKSASRVPQGKREWTVLALSFIMLGTFVNMAWRFVPNFHRLREAGFPDSPAILAALIVAESLAALVVLSAGLFFFYDAVFSPARKLANTRYLITNRRVLIQVGREELHLDRSRIVDVIPSPVSNGLSDIFLVLDGPRARALAISGAFGEQDTGTSAQLRPVLQLVEDAESVSQILLEKGVAPKAA